MSRLLTVVACCFFFTAGLGQIAYPGKEPGKAAVNASRTEWQLKNNSVRMQWRLAGGTWSLESFTDVQARQQLDLRTLPFFELHLKDGRVLSSGDFRVIRAPVVEKVKGRDSSLKYAGRLKGRKISVDMLNKPYGIALHWAAVLTDEANYVQQFFHIKTTGEALDIDTIKLVNLPGQNDICKVGAVDGSPLVFRNMFFAIEHPMAQVDKSKAAVFSFLPRQAPIDSVHPVTISNVFGVTPAGQLRRGYLYYVERERAAPYRQYLHYNSWYDLSWIDRKLNEALCMDRIQAFADSLIVKRKTLLDAFMFDDGWDDNKTLWEFNSGFPDGFANLAKKANHYGAHLGSWISPWGGYLEDQKQRLEYGRKQNPPFETNENGFTLAGPVYYQQFQKVARTFATRYDVAIFKYDGVGAGNGANGAGVKYQKDIEALLKLTTDLRKVKPDLFFNLTVGTWPSVYWLKYGDAIWRAGKDTDMKGVGSNRQKWITYHDAEVYKNVVQRAPLYPLNSLMYHGICIAQNGPPAKFEINDKDIADEIWAYFGTGTNLQELYINPHLLNTANWNTLAEAIGWARANNDVLADVHWVGGDPAQLQVYGFAAWNPGKAVLTLRNPSAERKSFEVRTSEVFQLPPAVATRFRFYNARTKEKKAFAEGASFSITLEPYEVKVLNAMPQ